MEAYIYQLEYQSYFQWKQVINMILIFAAVSASMVFQSSLWGTSFKEKMFSKKSTRVWGAITLLILLVNVFITYYWWDILEALNIYHK